MNKREKRKQLIVELQKFKQHNELTYEDLARMIGVSTWTVWRWLKKQNLPAALAAEKLEEFLKEAKGAKND